MESYSNIRRADGGSKVEAACQGNLALRVPISRVSVLAAIGVTIAIKSVGVLWDARGGRYCCQLEVAAAVA